MKKTVVLVLSLASLTVSLSASNVTRYDPLRDPNTNHTVFEMTSAQLKKMDARAAQQAAEAWKSINGKRTPREKKWSTQYKRQSK